MNEGEIRQLAQLAALSAEMYAVNAGIEGMKAANEDCKTRGDGMACDQSMFDAAAKDLEDIAARMREEI